jgi:hydrogenase maturation protease
VSPPTLIIGLGSEAASDDVAGIAVARRLACHAGPEREIWEIAGAGVDLIPRIGQRREIVLIDAVVGGALPGTIHFGITASAADPPACSHRWNAAAMLRLAEALGVRVPRTYLIGIEAESLEPGLEVSASVAAAVEWLAVHFDEAMDLVRNASDMPLRLVPPRWIDAA